MPVKAPPQNELELLKRAHELAGKTFLELATNLKQTLPPSFRQAKGFMGQLIELQLGASAGNKPLPDFINLGIELKTLPYNQKGEPQETTYVCTAPFSQDSLEQHWEHSRVRAKLQQVLWIPIEADPKTPIAERRVGSAFLFKLNQHPKIEAILKQDWEELMEMLQLGQHAALSASYGQYLHIRPKAAHSRILKSRLNILNEEEDWVGPKGFYLRTHFTRQLLREQYCLSR